MRIAGLFHYPVKSLRGLAVDELTLEARGPRHDREWMVVDSNGRFLTQRTTPRMASLTARLRTGQLELSDDLGAVLLVEPTSTSSRDVTVWRDTVTATDCGDAAATWLTARLGQPCRLVRMPDSTIRPVDPKYSPRPDAHTTFADAYPVLLTNAASLDDLNTNLPAPLGMERFRANVVISGAPAWAEDEWRAVTLGSITFDLVKPCARCVVITTDQRTGEQPNGSAPLSTLARLRTLQPFGAIFGQNAVHRSTGTLRVGDELHVVTTQPRPSYRALEQ
ncbi:MAG: MOSC domain-containing protein [Archangiaceae bacterium]|nr:MOSC domain-containing protein [Archangiaceae bacterium]